MAGHTIIGDLATLISNLFHKTTVVTVPSPYAGTTGTPAATSYDQSQLTDALSALSSGLALNDFVPSATTGLTSQSSNVTNTTGATTPGSSDNGNSSIPTGLPAGTDNLPLALGGSGYGGAVNSGITNSNPAFPAEFSNGLPSYSGPLDTVAESNQALGLPAGFQFGGEPDPYVVGSLAAFQAGAASGNAASQAGLAEAQSQGANFSGYA
jgi:hypothetical protein